MKQKRDEIMNPELNPESDAGKLMRVRFREVSHFNCWVRANADARASAGEVAAV
jgi:hypothetical protein